MASVPTGVDRRDARRTRWRAGRAGRRTVLGLVAAISAVALVAAGCSSDGSDSVRNLDTVTIGYAPWAEDVAVTTLFQERMENAGYKVETKQMDLDAIFSGMATGDVDMFLDTWLPTTHQKQWDKYGDQLEDLGVWYDDASLHLTVPSYVTDVDSIADLKDHAEEFDGKIIGIEAAAGITDRAEHHALPDYGLDGVMTVQQSSTADMVSQLEAAIENRKPIVVTLWHPHWLYSRYDLKDLQDPRGSMGQTQNLHIVARSGFSSEYPNVASVARDFTISGDRLESLEEKIQAAGQGNAADAVREWSEADANQDFINRMFGTLSNVRQNPH